MTDWSDWQQGTRPPGPPVRGSRRHGGPSVAASVGLLLALAALLQIASAVAVAVINDRGGGLGLQGRLNLASEGANALTALLLIGAMVLVRPAAIGGARRAEDSGVGSLAAMAGMIGSFVVTLTGCYECVTAFTDRPVLPDFLGEIGLSFGSRSATNLPANIHISALAGGLAVLLLGGAGLRLAFHAMITD